MMDAVTAAHEHYCLRGGEHVFAADGTVTVGRTLYTAMCISDGYGHAYTASLQDTVKMLSAFR